MAMTSSQKTQRSATLRAVKGAAAVNGITVIDQFEHGGRALVGTKGFETVVWLESDQRWHHLAD